MAGGSDSFGTIVETPRTILYGIGNNLLDHTEKIDLLTFVLLLIFVPQ
jgi:hypothetical protein